MNFAERSIPQVPVPPSEVEDDLTASPSIFPPAPTWTPPPVPSTRDVKGKGAWRPSGPTTPPVETPPVPRLELPSPPTDEEMAPPVSPVSPVDTISHIRPPTPPSPVRRHRPDHPPTFDESQAQLRHTNPLLAHPTPQPTNYYPPEKVPLDQLERDTRSFELPKPSPPRVQVPVAPVIGPPANLEPTSSSSSDPFTASTTTTISGPSSPNDQHHGQKSNWFQQLGHKTTNSINNLAHKFGGTGFLPDTLDNECEKAALILRTFCKKGIYADTPSPGARVPSFDGGEGSSSSSAAQKRPSKTLVTIPPKVIKKAIGLAIFTTFRAGFQFKGATGSGILVSRQHDGSWTGPSAIQLSSFGGGLFVAGMDVFDCVCVINTQEALNAFMDTRVSIGGEMSIVAGPWGGGGSVEWGAAMDKRYDGENGEKSSPTEASPPSPPSLEVNGEPAKVNKETRPRRGSKSKKLSPVFSYVKSRGFYAGFGYDGTIVTERKAANANFYGATVSCEQILRGQVPPPEDNPSLQKLFDVLRGAEGGCLRATQSEVTLAGAAPSPDDDIPPVPDLPPAYPVDSLHPMEAFGPEKR